MSRTQVCSSDQPSRPQVQFNTFLPTLQHRTGPGHFTSSSTSQALNGLPPVINLPWTKPLVCKGSKALAKPPSLFPKLTSKLGEVLASLRLVAKRSRKVKVLLHSDPISLYIHQSQSTNSLNYSWKFFSCKICLGYFFICFFHKDDTISSNNNTFLTGKSPGIQLP